VQANTGWRIGQPQFHGPLIAGDRGASLDYPQAATGLHALHCSDDFRPIKHAHKSVDCVRGVAPRAGFEVFGQYTLCLLQRLNDQIAVSLHEWASLTRVIAGWLLFFTLIQSRDLPAR
jgi:hypothetical protein